ncbi:hypothetical protein NYQ10_19115 [Flavobacterium johnsoniae]|uniref:hypothetical protein n=1 Tax=Flavobacterium johnsoniae TaxID=986 RepID=UPI0025AF75CC|nr:hypothetical protein [Flavobacterium johnsoniae]WJS94202.1 hypothetical protein NYQ10_19115 [Flavobacterium johnsoniae]
MHNQTTTEFNDKFPEKEKDSNFEQNMIVPTTDSFYLYGMTFEQYQEGKEIHSKYFDQLKNLVN